MYLAADTGSPFDRTSTTRLYTGVLLPSRPGHVSATCPLHVLILNSGGVVSLPPAIWYVMATPDAVEYAYTGLPTSAFVDAFCRTKITSCYYSLPLGVPLSTEQSEKCKNYKTSDSKNSPEVAQAQTDPQLPAPTTLTSKRTRTRYMGIRSNDSDPAV